MNFRRTKITVNEISPEETEAITIDCHVIDDDVKEIVSFVKSRQGQLTGKLDGEQYEISVKDILYLESVDNRVFIYTSKQSYETSGKLYELEELLKQKSFLRISKSTIVNLMKIKSIKPSLNARFIAVLSNGEEIMISRKYVADLKKTLKGGQ